MGGYGSGVSGWKPKSEQTFKIDVQQMQRNGSLRLGTTSTNRWSRADVLLAEISMTSWGNMIIVHTKPEQCITLTSTSCHYGGQRPWFLCPVCNRRVAILYQVSEHLSCSHCSDISYYSRNESQLDRLLRKKNKLRKQLTVDDGWGLDFFRRAKGMHRKTYDRLLDEFAVLEMVIDEQADARFGEFL